MCQVKYRVTLSTDERSELKGIVVSDRSSKLSRKRAYLLMALDEAVPPGALSDEDAAKALGMSASTAQTVRRLFVLEGFEAALRGKPRAHPPTPPKINGELEARLVQMACSKPPQGYGRWSLRLLQWSRCRAFWRRKRFGHMGNRFEHVGRQKFAKALGC